MKKELLILSVAFNVLLVVLLALALFMYQRAVNLEKTPSKDKPDVVDNDVEEPKTEEELEKEQSEELAARKKVYSYYDYSDSSKTGYVDFVSSDKRLKFKYPASYGKAVEHKDVETCPGRPAGLQIEFEKKQNRVISIYPCGLGGGGYAKLYGYFVKGKTETFDVSVSQVMTQEEKGSYRVSYINDLANGIEMGDEEYIIHVYNRIPKVDFYMQFSDEAGVTPLEDLKMEVGNILSTVEYSEK